MTRWATRASTLPDPSLAAHAITVDGLTCRPDSE